MKVICAHCKTVIDKPTGAVNRALKIKAGIYCDRICSGLSRRKNLTNAQKKKLKREYDKRYRDINKKKIRKRKQVYERSPSGRAMQKRNREKFKKFHLEYCRTPEYRKWKQEYDLKYRAKKVYGEFHESFLLIKEIEKLYSQQEVRQINNLHNKSQKRKRKCKTQNKNYLQRT